MAFANNAPVGFENPGAPICPDRSFPQPFCSGGKSGPIEHRYHAFHPRRIAEAV
jgi:hypothetical protein